MNTLNQSANALRVMARQLRTAALTLEVEAEYVEAGGARREPVYVFQNRRWNANEDAVLEARARQLQAEGVRGDALAEALSDELERSPVAVAARLVKVGVWA